MYTDGKMIFKKSPAASFIFLIKTVYTTRSGAGANNETCMRSDPGRGTGANDEDVRANLELQLKQHLIPVSKPLKYIPERCLKYRSAR